jgi:hypothetical protein
MSHQCLAYREVFKAFFISSSGKGKSQPKLFLGYSLHSSFLWLSQGTGRRTIESKIDLGGSVKSCRASSRKFLGFILHPQTWSTVPQPERQKMQLCCRTQLRRKQDSILRIFLQCSTKSLKESWRRDRDASPFILEYTPSIHILSSQKTPFFKVWVQVSLWKAHLLHLCMCIMCTGGGEGYLTFWEELRFSDI